ncbi:hypothetical protein CSB95_5816 [Pseudomonas aeruginosa]|nr:hypothetical protein CSC29_7163 [Pseudomonas aeruginosa]PRW19407.1 hypothetical protein CSB95_5816 [Pseudomonas aeruginosa]
MSFRFFFFGFLVNGFLFFYKYFLNLFLCAYWLLSEMDYICFRMIIIFKSCLSF